jgi:hypothetical protein
VTGLPDQNFGNRNAFVLRLVRQHRPRNDVSDRPDTGDVCCIVMIDNHTSALVKLHADLAEAEALGVRHSSDRDQNDVGFDRFCRPAFRRLDCRLQLLSG